jgi:hypothetical protein
METKRNRPAILGLNDMVWFAVGATAARIAALGEPGSFGWATVGAIVLIVAANAVAYWIRRKAYEQDDDGLFPIEQYGVATSDYYLKRGRLWLLYNDHPHLYKGDPYRTFLAETELNRRAQLAVALHGSEDDLTKLAGVRGLDIYVQHLLLHKRWKFEYDAAAYGECLYLSCAAGALAANPTIHETTFEALCNMCNANVDKALLKNPALPPALKKIVEDRKDMPCFERNRKAALDRAGRSNSNPDATTTI